MAMDELLDIAAVAAYLGVSERTVYDRVRAGDLPAVKIGRLWRVRAADLEAWLGSRANGPAAVPAPGPYPYPDVAAPIAAETGPVPSRGELEAVVGAFSDRVERRLAFIAVLSRGVESLGWPAPVVAGGHAVEFYTAGGYATTDIDLIGASEPVAEVLSSWGFALQGRHWCDDALGIVAEVPGARLDEGEREHVAALSIGGMTAYIIGIEDLIIDRLNACVHWLDEESCAWAVTLLAAAEDLDLPYLRERAAEGDVASRLQRALEEAGRA